MKYTLDQAKKIYNLPITVLMFKAMQVHNEHHDPTSIQLSSLKSIKTGACSEDCKYCPQSVLNKTGIVPEKLLDSKTILRDAQAAQAGGADRFCMGAAWREMINDRQLNNIVETVKAVKELGLEVCLTLGMLTEEQARALKEAGCDYYNHNLDTSREFYPSIISTRTYDDRLNTIENVRKAGMSVCSGGILGMGESIDDRLKLLIELSNLNPPPESVPINALIPVKGTPLEEQEPIDPIEFIRTIATARILLPASFVRLSAGRSNMSEEMQAMCFVAGANSIFLGEKLLTAPNSKKNSDMEMLKRFGLNPFKKTCKSDIKNPEAAQAALV